MIFVTVQKTFATPIEWQWCLSNVILLTWANQCCQDQAEEPETLLPRGNHACSTHDDRAHRVTQGWVSAAPGDEPCSVALVLSLTAHSYGTEKQGPLSFGYMHKTTPGTEGNNTLLFFLFVSHQNGGVHEKTTDWKKGRRRRESETHFPLSFSPSTLAHSSLSGLSWAGLLILASRSPLLHCGGSLVPPLSLICPHRHCFWLFCCERAGAYNHTAACILVQVDGWTVPTPKSFLQRKKGFLVWSDGLLQL